MDTLIYFRSLCDQLTQTEFTSFIQTILKKPEGKQIMTKWIFQALKNTPNDIVPFTNMISNIIKNRPKHHLPHQSVVIPQPSRINHLPSPLISECASYLKFNEYFNFIKTNRKTYISLHQHPKIIELEIICKYFNRIPRTYKLSLFRNSESLVIVPSFFNHAISFKNQSTWKKSQNLKTILLINTVGLNIFLSRKLLNHHNINNLVLTSLNYAEYPTYSANINSFLKTLSYFPMIQSLEISSISFKSIIPSTTNPFSNSIQKQVQKYCSNVRFLRIRAGHSQDLKLYQCIVNAIGANIEALQIFSLNVNSPLYTLKAPRDGWRNLQELVIWYPTTESVTTFLSNVAQLRRSMIVADKWDIYRDWIQNMVTKQLELQLLNIWCHPMLLTKMMGEIEAQILQNSVLQRKSEEFTVKIICELVDVSINLNGDSFTSMMRLFEAMMNVDEWSDVRLILLLHTKDRLELKQSELLVELDKMKQDYLIRYGECQVEQPTGCKYGYRFVISNKGCGISGYSMYHEMRSTIHSRYCY